MQKRKPSGKKSPLLALLSYWHYYSIQTVQALYRQNDELSVTEVDFHQNRGPFVRVQQLRTNNIADPARAPAPFCALLWFYSGYGLPLSRLVLPDFLASITSYPLPFAI